MATIIGLDGQEQEVIDLTPKQKQPIITYDRKPYQDDIQDKSPEEPYTPVVYASMQHSYPPIKILDMKVDHSNNTHQIHKQQYHQQEDE